MVYGAYANNPVPLTEDAVLRPDVDFVYARQLATVEALADRWRRAEPGRTRHRAAAGVAMAADGTSSLARALAAGFGQRFGEDDPPAQFLHLDDLASAVVLAVDRRLDGVFNVAPDGWVAGERVRALTGARPRIRLPDRVAEVVVAVRWRFQRGPIPPGLRSYTREPWLVANDRLKAARLAPDGDQRAGLRRGHRGPVVDDDHAQAPPGADARPAMVRAGRRGGRRRRQLDPGGGGGVAAADRRATSSASTSPSTSGVVGRASRRTSSASARRRRWSPARSSAASPSAAGGRRRRGGDVVVVDVPGIVGTVEHRRRASSSVVHRPMRSPSSSRTGVASATSSSVDHLDDRVRGAPWTARCRRRRLDVARS